MKIIVSKCIFNKNQTEYLGFIIAQQDVKTDTVKIQAIGDRTTPTEIIVVQAFLEFCNPYRRFSAGYSPQGRPLYARTNKECIVD